MEAEVGVMQSQAQDSELSAEARSEFSPSASGGSAALPTP